jgi:molecular chaperone Hsp33
VNEIAGIHETTPNATAPLARTITAGALLAATLKPDSAQSVSLKFSGSGPLREVHVQADARGNIRAYVGRTDVDAAENFDSIDFSRAIGAGFLTVVRDLGLRDPYTSHVPLLAGDVARDIAYYLTESEQIPSALILGLEWDSREAVAASGGILIQTFPGTDQSAIALVEKNITGIGEPLGSQLMKGRDIHDIVSDIFDGNPLTILGEHAIRAACRCSQEVLALTLMTLPREDIEDMIEEDDGARIACTFCRKTYHFSGNDLRGILERKKTSLS